MYQKFTKLAWLLMFLQVFATQLALADDEKDSNALRIELEQLVNSGSLRKSDVRIASGNLLLKIYAQRNYLPAWNNQQQIGEMVSAIKATAADGLDPSDYHLERVELIYADRLAGRQSSPEEKAVQDLILTDSLARLGYHQLFGKVNPYSLDSNWNFRRDFNGVDPVTAIQRTINSPSLTNSLRTFFPRGWFYQKLQKALADYRQIAASGGWPVIPDGPTLKPGASDDRLPVLAQRLIITGDLPPRDTVGKLTTYDESPAAGSTPFSGATRPGYRRRYRTGNPACIERARRKAGRATEGKYRACALGAR